MWNNKSSTSPQRKKVRGDGSGRGHGGPVTARPEYQLRAFTFVIDWKCDPCSLPDTVAQSYRPTWQLARRSACVTNTQFISIYFHRRVEKKTRGDPIQFFFQKNNLHTTASYDTFLIETVSQRTGARVIIYKISLSSLTRKLLDTYPWKCFHRIAIRIKAILKKTKVERKSKYFWRSSPHSGYKNKVMQSFILQPEF